MKQATEYLISQRFRKRHGESRGEKGAIAVELAVVLPLFAILLTGIFEFGLMTHQHQILQNAAREGARYSSLAPQNNNISAVQNRVIAYLANEGITVASGDITVNQAYKITIGAGPLTVNASNVTVTYSRPVLFNGSTTFFGLGPIVLKGNAVFQNFY